jgi:hypothetical protein
MHPAAHVGRRSQKNPYLAARKTWPKSNQRALSAAKYGRSPHYRADSERVGSHDAPMGVRMVCPSDIWPCSKRLRVALALVYLIDHGSNAATIGPL